MLIDNLHLAGLEEPLPLVADKVRITRCIANLLNNAAKYTPSGGYIEAGSAARGESVVIHVTDTGFGLDATELSTIFEMFWQIRGHLKHACGGLGLGLALVKQLVELHAEPSPPPAPAAAKAPPSKSSCR